MKQTISQWVIQRMQIVNLAIVVWTFMGPAGDILASSPKVMHQPVITVRIYNYAHVYSLDLHDAEGHAAYLFARAGVRIAWTDYSENARLGPEQSEEAGIDFFVRILPAAMAAQFNRRPCALGQSVIPLGVRGPTRGGIANVSYESAKDASSTSGPYLGEVLGDAIAHELGHLLLGARHSSQGITKARWTLRDLKAASRGRLLFSPAEGELLQTAARSLPRNSFAMAAAGR